MAPARTLDIPVFCGPDSPSPDIGIQITRVNCTNNKGSSSTTAANPDANQDSNSPRKPCSPPSSSFSNLKVYGAPLTPGPRKNVPVDNVPRLDLMSARPCKGTSIFEVPPTPPGVVQAPKLKVREISVTSSTPLRPDHDIQQLPVQIHTQIEQPHNKMDKKAEEYVSEEFKEPEAIDIDAKSSLNPSESNIIDFSLFLLKNAKARDSIRGSIKKGLQTKNEVQQQEEEDLEALLRRWEAAQLEEEAAARAKEEEMLNSCLSVPTFPTLKELPFINFINSEGKIDPPVAPDTVASVFAVFDRLKKAQYIGVTKNIRNTLRKIMGRKPGFCYFYKLYNILESDGVQQSHLLKKQWIEELGSNPPGNSDARQWEQALDAVGSSSCLVRGEALAAAIQKAKALIQIMVERGLKEEMVYDPALMELGRCDVLEATTPAEAPKGKHTVIKTPHGGTIEYYICYNDKAKTNSGWKYDVSLNKDGEETRHLITCGSTCPGNLPEDAFLELVMAFLLHKGVPRNKDCRGFSMSNFSVWELVQKFDDFKQWFPRIC